MSKSEAAAPATEKPAKAPKIEQNGVSRPGAGTATARIWEIADAQSAAKNAPTSRAEVLKAAEAEGINVTTAATQFGRWCKFNGVKAAPKEPKPAKEKKVKGAKAAEVAAAQPEAVPA